MVESIPTLASLVLATANVVLIHNNLKIRKAFKAEIKAYAEGLANAGGRVAVAESKTRLMGEARVADKQKMRSLEVRISKMADAYDALRDKTSGAMLRDPATGKIIGRAEW